MASLASLASSASSASQAAQASLATLATLESDLTKDFRRFHLAAQAQRLLGGSVSAFLVELTAGGTHGWSTKALIAAAVGAVWTTARLQWPSVPWALVTSHLHAAKASEQAAAADAESLPPAPAGPGAPAIPVPPDAATNGPGS